MSTVKAVNLQHPNSSNPNMVLGSDGSISGALPAGGRNKIINGGFDVWQRGTSFTPSASTLTYTADRWAFYKDGTFTSTISQQAFTPGTAPVTGYEGTYYMRYNCTASNNQFTVISQSIEDVRTLAGQTVTLSFWAKADASRSISIGLQQNYGTGGSGQIDTASASATIGTTWTRYVFSGLSVASLSGKTLGPNSKMNVCIYVGNGTGTVDLWGVQIEAGNAPTAFEVKPYAQELRDCQRYFVSFGGNAVYECVGTGNSISTTRSYFSINLPVEMRAVPSVSYSAVGDWRSEMVGSYAGIISSIARDLNTSTPRMMNLDCYHASEPNMGGHNFTRMIAVNTLNARLYASAEL